MTLSAISCQTNYHLTTLFGVTNAPNNAATALALGTSNPNLVVPGLCGTVFTDFAVMLSVGTTDASGSISQYTNPASMMFKTTPAPGATVYAQFHSLDAGSSLSIPVASSQGMRIVLPSLTPSSVVEITRLYIGNATATKAMLDFYGL